MSTAQAEPTFHLFEVTDQAQIEATRKTLHPLIKERLEKRRIRVVGLVITTVVDGQMILTHAGGYGAWVVTTDEFKTTFEELPALPCSLPWSQVPEFIRSEYEDNLVDEGGMAREKHHWVEIEDGERMVVTPW